MTEQCKSPPAIESGVVRVGWNNIHAYLNASHDFVRLSPYLVRCKNCGFINASYKQASKKPFPKKKAI